MAEISNYSFSLGPGTLYTAIKRLLEQGYIKEQPAAKSKDARRRYYMITPKGLSLLSGALEQYESITHIARSYNILKKAHSL